MTLAFLNQFINFTRAKVNARPLQFLLDQLFALFRCKGQQLARNKLRVQGKADPIRQYGFGSDGCCDAECDVLSRKI